MAPLWPQPTSRAREASVDRLFAFLGKACNEAFEFAILLRWSKDCYRCELLARQSTLQNDSEAQTREPSHDPPLTAENIAYAISAALAKYPLDDPKRRIVLEKAHVVVY